eukprot:COSAG01_NODE_37033_length_509_cov_1.126829_1_plen_86_part_01
MTLCARIAINGTSDSDTPVDGGVFTTLRVGTLSTNLPVHVNAGFELNDGRKDMLWDTSMSGSGKWRHKWNQIILDELIPRAYRDLL